MGVGCSAFGASFAQHLEEQRCLDPCPAWTLGSNPDVSAGRGTPRVLSLHGTLPQVTCTWTEAEDEDGGPPACWAGALFCPLGQR